MATHNGGTATELNHPLEPVSRQAFLDQLAIILGKIRHWYCPLTELQIPAVSISG